MSKPTLRQCILYALPALLIGLALRVSYVAAIPEAFVNADTNSYLHSGYHLWHHGKTTSNDKRRWWYPVWVAVTPPLPGTIAQTAAAAHHLAALGGLICVAWIIGQLTHFWRLCIPPATLLVAIWPQMLYYEHVFLGEAFFLTAFMLAAALSLPIERLKEPGRLFQFLLALTLAVGIRPSGRALWGAAVILLIFAARQRSSWVPKNIIAGVFCTVIAFTTGSSKDGSRLLLSSMLPLLDTKRGPHAEYRQALEPIVQETRQHGSDYAWFQKLYKKRIDSEIDPGVGEKWRRLTERNEEFRKVCRTLAIETVLQHPIAFAQFTLTKFLAAAAQPDVPIRSHALPTEFDPNGFWREQMKQNAPRWAKMGDRLRWIYGGLDRAEWEKLAAERQTRTLWFAKWMNYVEFGLPWVRRTETGSEVPLLRVSWLGWLATAGFVLCLLPRFFVPAMMLWLPLAGYVVLTFGVGDRLPRFLHPIQWIGICLCLIAVDAVLSAGARLLNRGRAAEPPRP